jgi:threonine synthase
MDVGDPSNFVRILELFGHQFECFTNKISGYSIDDQKTMNTITEVYQKYHYILDPHSAVAFALWNNILKKIRVKKGLFWEQHIR